MKIEIDLDQIVVTVSHEEFKLLQELVSAGTIEIGSMDKDYSKIENLFHTITLT